MPEPKQVALEQPWNIFVTGIGGTGVITIGALLGTAAHLEGKQVSVLDMTGMSQKNGSVTSHIRMATATTPLHAQRIATGEADLILGCDMLTAASADAIAKTQPGRTQALINLHEQPIGSFAQQPDWQYPAHQVKDLLHDALAGAVSYVDAHQLATHQLGDGLLSNMLMLGFAWQRGWIPVSLAALKRAIELNGVAVQANFAALALGRRQALQAIHATQAEHSAQPVAFVPSVSRVALPKRSQSLNALIDQHAEFLKHYQNAAYAQSYSQAVARVQQAEQAQVPQATHLPLTRAFAQGLARLMAYKDEYEVARLYAHPEFAESLAKQFEGQAKLRFHLAPPLLARKDAQGHLIKSDYGAWVLPVFRLLAKLRGLRGTWLDAFGYTQERKIERALIDQYQTRVFDLLASLTFENHPHALKVASAAEKIRGFGHVKLRNIELVQAEWDALECQT